MQFKQILPILATTLASTVLMSANSSNATNLIINGGFADTSEAGLNAFTSDYNLDGVKGDDLWIFLEDRNLGEYIISSNPAGNVPEEWPELSSFDSGNDNMLVADSFSSGSEERVLWGQEVNVKAGTTYSFNFAVARIFTTDVIVDAKVNGLSILSEPKALSKQGKWDFLEANWGANSSGFVTLEIFQNRNISLGTDIALDAISLTAISESIPEPTSIISLMILGLGFLVENMTGKSSK